MSCALAGDFPTKSLNYGDHLTAKTELYGAPSSSAIVVCTCFGIDALNRLHDDRTKSGLINSVMLFVRIPIGRRPVIQQEKSFLSKYRESKYDLFDFRLDVSVAVVALRQLGVWNSSEYVSAFAIEPPSGGNPLGDPCAVFARDKQRIKLV
ncbi:MAG: hypothetical protein J3T61_11685 [Candidatus Brocadiales bacterium]|nr:hypothetical protein [Candidatus Bathyanammoxibius sp.]